MLDSTPEAHTITYLEHLEVSPRLHQAVDRLHWPQNFPQKLPEAIANQKKTIGSFRRLLQATLKPVEVSRGCR